MVLMTPSQPISSLNWPKRLRAAGIHLLSCLIVAACAAAVVLLVWYPWPYRIVSGGEDLLFLLMTVDVIMGPLITLAIFDLRKPRTELRRDLTIIVLLQLAALGYGLYAVYMSRPVVLALEVDRFRVTTAIGVEEAELPLASPPLRSLSVTGPRLVDVNLPDDNDKLDAIMKGMAGLDLGARPRYWREWDSQSRQRALKAGRPVADWLATHPEVDGLRSGIERTGLPPSRLLYLPMLARRNDWSVLVDKTTGDPVGFAPINAD
ncbi:TfpX/TfpZ family type IV pilin accessory protein [Roseateles sp. MS654]|uniref:TfpX/TfpZ family type IV pilin accessory protein n=1 Tax=Roseateles sp. MS654 TaxID=3412685 RepID=UPI003C2CF9AD